jgi:hypothetical protein
VVPGDGFEPPTRGFSIQSKNQAKQGASVSKAPKTDHELNDNVSNADNKAKENPASTGMDHGAMWNGHSVSEIQYQTNLPPAMALVLAIVKCDRLDACEIMEQVLEELALDMPIPPFLGIMDQAAFWADMATQREAKAYALACYNRLTPDNQAAFLNYVQGRAAA